MGQMLVVTPECCAIVNLFGHAQYQIAKLNISIGCRARKHSYSVRHE